jgi:hypothetical protein
MMAGYRSRYWDALVAVEEQTGLRHAHQEEAEADMKVEVAVRLAAVACLILAVDPGVKEVTQETRRPETRAVAQRHMLAAPPWALLQVLVVAAVEEGSLQVADMRAPCCRAPHRGQHRGLLHSPPAYAQCPPAPHAPSLPCDADMAMPLLLKTHSSRLSASQHTHTLTRAHTV